MLDCIGNKRNLAVLQLYLLHTWLSGVTAACWQTGRCLERWLMEWQSGGVWRSGLKCIDMAQILGVPKNGSGWTDW